MFSSFLVSALAFNCAFSHPVQENNYVLHEQLGSVHPRWSTKMTLPRSLNPQLQMRIALTQQNLQHSEDFLMSVSDPISPLFAQHWTPEKITSTFAPSEESIEYVTKWLIYSGVDAEQIARSRDGGWLHFPIGVNEAEGLLRAKYHVYSDEVTGEKQLACESYSIPESVKEHIDFIMPTVHLIPRPSKSARSLNKRKSHDLSLQPIKTSTLALSDQRMKPKDLSICDSFTTPDCLRALYNMPEGKTANPKNTYGILELSPETYSQPGLDVFFRNFTPGLVGRPPRLESVDGGAILPPGPPPITSSVSVLF